MRTKQFRSTALAAVAATALAACGDTAEQPPGTIVDAAGEVPFFPTSDTGSADVPGSADADAAAVADTAEEPDMAAAPDAETADDKPECTGDGDCKARITDPCTPWICALPSGVCQPSPLQDGVLCGGDACVAGRVCEAGVCLEGVAVDCDDGDPCTEDSCNAAFGCLNAPIEECCVPQCEGKECGLDGCGGLCGECAAGATCVDPGVCQGCEPQCAGKECGPDGCGGICGNCPDGWGCGLTGLCEEGVCTPDCAVKECGPDGCGGSCGGCPDGWSCTALGLCEAGLCTPNCAGKECGTDGCGGECGTCDLLDTCAGGVCQGLFAGDDCTDPYVVGALPWTTHGDTTLAWDDYAMTGAACTGGSEGFGDLSGDHVYAFTPSQGGTYRITLATGWDSVLYVTETCPGSGASCVAASDQSTIFGTEQVDLWLGAGSTAFVFVDGYEGFMGNWGAYDLSIQLLSAGGCEPQCAGKACGPDGCGGECGECAGAGEVCTAAGLCEAAPEGEVCEAAFTVGALPFEKSASTDLADDDYSGKCPPDITTTVGDGCGDHAYAFVPPETGTYTVTVAPADFDAVVMLVSDCTKLSNTCVGGADYGVTGDAESVTQVMAAGVAYYVIVDGYGGMGTDRGDYTIRVEAQ